MAGFTEGLPPPTKGRPGPAACEATMRRHSEAGPQADPQRCHDRPRSRVTDCELSGCRGDISLSQWVPEGKYIHAHKGSYAAVARDVITSAINYSY